MSNAYIEYDNFIPLLAPADVASTITATPYMDLKYAQRAAFLVFIGAVTSASADIECMTLEGATAPTGVEAAVGFTYRLSGAVGANTWGAPTAVGTTGLEIGLTDDNKIIWVEIDPSVMAASDYRYVRLRFTDVTDMGAFIPSVIGVVQSRYKQYTHLSATAAASA